MGFAVEVLEPQTYPRTVSEIVARALPRPGGSLVLTGGTTAERLYAPLADVARPHLSELEILFSDERCVPPDDDASNYKMASRLLLDPTGAALVHRMRGEDEAALAAQAYHQEISPLVERGLDLILLGMGADAHIGAMFPGSPALEESAQLCRAVERPDGMGGLTLTPPALLAGKKILLLVTAEGKAAAVKRVLKGSEPPQTCPARLLADHPDVTFLLDKPAASAL